MAVLKSGQVTLLEPSTARHSLDTLHLFRNDSGATRAPMSRGDAKHWLCYPTRVCNCSLWLPKGVLLFLFCCPAPPPSVCVCLCLACLPALLPFSVLVCVWCGCVGVGSPGFLVRVTLGFSRSSSSQTQRSRTCQPALWLKVYKTSRQVWLLQRCCQNLTRSRFFDGSGA